MKLAFESKPITKKQLKIGFVAMKPQTVTHTLLNCFFLEYAVCTNERIILYDDKWTELEPMITRKGCDQIKAITYDTVNDIFYFTDRKNPETSVFSLKVRDDMTFLTTPLIPRSVNEVIEDLVYDFHDQALYMSDSGNKRIVKITINRDKNLKWTRTTFLNVSEDISGLEIDTCQRKLYFTIVSKTDPSINVVSLDGRSKPISFGSENHFNPVALAMDHQNRRLYVADVREFNSYSIDSILTSGKSFRTEIEMRKKTPRSLAVDKTNVYYVEGTSNELRQFVKESGNKESTLLKEMSSDPSDIIVKSNFLADWNSKVCNVNPETIKKAVDTMRNRTTQQQEATKICLHGGSIDKTSSSCICKENFDGKYCEVNLCYNFCMNGGDCSMAKNEYTQKVEPVCSCMKGFEGKHCEVDLCTNFCLNDGKCSVGLNKKPICACTGAFIGSRCELSTDETVPVIINSQPDVTSEAVAPTKEATKLHEDYSLDDIHSGSHLRETESENEQSNVHTKSIASQQCSDNSMNTPFVILAVCITTSLLIFLAILVVIKKFNRPLRPKIRKKYVVHKNTDQSLAYRPTTEQCEVIIEDCCNMNICETVREMRNL